MTAAMAIVFSALAVDACSASSSAPTSPTTSTPSAPISPTSPATNATVSLASIGDLKVAVTVEQPPEVLVYFQGGLPNTCTSFYNLTTATDSNAISITVYVQTATGEACGQIYTFFDKTADLGSNFLPGQVYTISVNDQPTTLTMP